jgi:hypothetical protein
LGRVAELDLGGVLRTLLARARRVLHTPSLEGATKPTVASNHGGLYEASLLVGELSQDPVNNRVGVHCLNRLLKEAVLRQQATRLTGEFVSGLKSSEPSFPCRLPTLPTKHFSVGFGHRSSPSEKDPQPRSEAKGLSKKRDEDEGKNDPLPYGFPAAKAAHTVNRQSLL